jgi:vacuolar protein sorting-associated protein 13A/C
MVSNLFLLVHLNFRWKFAITAILEENIRRRKRNWSWKRMKEHRQLVRDYRQAWVRKQTEKSLPIDVTALLEVFKRLYT